MTIIDQPSQRRHGGLRSTHENYAHWLSLLWKTVSERSQAA